MSSTSDACAPQRATKMWELLTVKLPLEEWRQWLEWSQVPFVVWTDHKNLSYIQTAKCLNSLVGLTLKLRIVLDLAILSLSRQNVYSDSSDSPETILPSSCLVGD